MTMQKYSLEGFYKYNGAQGKLTGKIEINSKDFFEGIITDHMSRTPEQIFKGKIRNIGEITKLEFFKFPPSASLANLAYQLEKPKSDDFSGKYIGQWGALPFKIEFNQNLDLLLAKIDMSVCGIGDSTEINLYKK